MVNQSPQRSRKSQPTAQSQSQSSNQPQPSRETQTQRQQGEAQGVMQGPVQVQVQVQAQAQAQQQPSGPVRRDISPSPSLRERERERERQRYIRTQSMPIVTTASHPHPLDLDVQVQGQVQDSQSQAQGQPQPQPQPHYPRPVPISRVTQPQFLPHGLPHAHSHQGLPPHAQQQHLPHPAHVSLAHAEKWQMTEDLQADIDRADMLQQAQAQAQAQAQQQQQQQQQQSQRGHSRSPVLPPPAPGTAGVAYAGGAVSAGASFALGHTKTHSAGSVGVSVGTDVVDIAGPPMARRRMSAEQAQHRASPLSYALRKAANTSPGYPSMPSPRSMKNRTPDRSLPVQEEPDEHEHEHEHAQTTTSSVQAGGARASPTTPSSDMNPTKDLEHEHDAEGTLVDLGDDDDDHAGNDSGGGQARPNGESTEGEGSHTPRSPTALLFQQGQSQRNIHEVLRPDKPNGKRFSPADFQRTLKKLQSDAPAPAPQLNSTTTTNNNLNVNQTAPVAPMPPFSPFSRNEYSRNESRGSYPNWMFDFYHNYPDEMELYDYDEAAYMQQFMPSGAATAPPAPMNGSYTMQGSYAHSRPDAPIPPTPHSQTSAPTPFSRHQHNGGDSRKGAQDDEDHNGDINNIIQEPDSTHPHRQFIPPFSPAPPSGTPYPYPFSHVRRGGVGGVGPSGTFVYPPSVPPVPRVPSSVYDPNVVQEQLRLQMQMYAYNNAANAAAAAAGVGIGQMSEGSTLSTASTPYPGMAPSYTPFGAFLNQSRAYARVRAGGGGGGGAGFGVGVGVGGGGGGGVGGGMSGGYGEDGRVTSASMRSSPSHLPVSLPLPPLRGRGLMKRDRVANLRGSGGRGTNGSNVGVGVGRQKSNRVKPPPRVDSTQPRETSPELSSGEETAGEKYPHDANDPNSNINLNGRTSVEPRREWTTAQNNGVRHGHGEEDDEEENGEWVDEESEDEEDLLDLEFHTTYVTNPDRRRKRWEQRWEDLVRAFQALDRETDTTLLLLASPSHTTKLHSLSSRSIRRDASLFDGHAMHAARHAFGTIAAQRRSARSQARMSLVERLYASFSSSSAFSSSIPNSNSNSTSNSVPDANGNGNRSPGGGTESAVTIAGEREEELRRMLRTALHSLGTLHTMYEEREGRWRVEERRMREEREGVDLLIQQAFGGGGGGGGGGGMGMGMGM